jgi:inner membrane protein
MSPVTHGLLSWVLANSIRTDRRGRIAITLAGIAPDLDGFGYPVEALTRTSAQPIEWFHRYHHELTHNLPTCAAIAVLAWLFAGRSWRVAGLAGLAALLHLLCDLLGARGPDGYQWPLPLLQPWSEHGWTWSGQWGLASWQNFLITLAALSTTVALAVRRGFSPAELVLPRTDVRIVAALRAWLGLRERMPDAAAGAAAAKQAASGDDLS